MELTDSFHAVKEAAIADAAKQFGVKGIDALRRAGQFMGSNHPLPTWREKLPQGFIGPPQGGEGYGPGIMQSLRQGLRWGNTNLGNAIREGASNTAKNVGHNVAEAGRSLLVGDPVNMVNELKTRAGQGGLAKALGGYAKEYYAPANALQGFRQGSKWQRAGHGALLGLNVGLPALGLYSAIRHPDEANRGRAIGSSLAGLAAAPFTSRMGGQFGIGLGALAGQLAQRAGGAVGGLFDKQRPQLPPADYSFPGSQGY